MRSYKGPRQGYGKITNLEGEAERRRVALLETIHAIEAWQRVYKVMTEVSERIASTDPDNQDTRKVTDWNTTFILRTNLSLPSASSRMLADDCSLLYAFTGDGQLLGRHSVKKRSVPIVLNVQLQPTLRLRAQG
ncbi:hypothetical protein R1sor_006684 [Riccia sorocarpa]|uniref:Uncharacterized protein n=1 Tax=Riccia sorocarpa TaxID=122646 RepID=A0ABD3HN50_9MARC